MTFWLRLGLVTVVLCGLWAVFVAVSTLEGWWRDPLAPRDDPQAFMDAAIGELEAASAGNAVLALLEDGSIDREHAFSVGNPVGRDTVFQVASLSKWITAWGVMDLVEEGRLDLDAPVGTYLTRWALPESGFDHDGVTVRRLLSHTAGLVDGLGYNGFGPGVPVQTLEESLERAADAMPGAGGGVRVGYEPGTGWRYSGGGYTLLQLIVEDVTGETFEAYMQRAVLQPLGMSHSTFEWTPERGTALATFYDVDSTPATHYRFAALAAASLYTSVSDLARFLQAHRPGRHGEPVGRAVLEPETIALMGRPHGSRLGRDIWGLGVMLFVPNGRGGFIIGHDGNNAPAINTAARLDPATGDGFVMFETGNPRLASRLASEWVFWKTGAPDLMAIVTEAPASLRTLGVGWGVVAVVALAVAWRRLRRAKPALPEPNAL